MTEVAPSSGESQVEETTEGSDSSLELLELEFAVAGRKLLGVGDDGIVDILDGTKSVWDVEVIEVGD